MKSTKLKRIPIIYAVAMFLFSGAVSFKDGDLVLGYLNISIAAVNFVCLFLIDKYSRLVEPGLLMLDSVSTLAVGVKFVIDGKQYLQYAWLSAGVGYIVASMLVYKRSKRHDSKI